MATPTPPPISRHLLTCCAGFAFLILFVTALVFGLVFALHVLGLWR